MGKQEAKYDVFLSYSFKDRPWVSAFSDALREAGLTAWFDVANILPGERWDYKIQQALRESSTIVLIVSPNSVASPWTFFELGAAVADKKHIIPVLIGELEPEHIPIHLSRLQFLREPSSSEAGKRVAELVTRIRSQKELRM